MRTFTAEELQKIRAIVESGTPLARNTQLRLIEQIVDVTAENRRLSLGLSESGGRNIDLRTKLAAAEKVAVGFVIVDIKTRKLDWDGELHPTIEDALVSLTGPRQMWCRTPEEETDERTYYGSHYELLPVNA